MSSARSGAPDSLSTAFLLAATLGSACLPNHDLDRLSAGPATAGAPSGNANAGNAGGGNASGGSASAGDSNGGSASGATSANGSAGSAAASAGAGAYGEAGQGSGGNAAAGSSASGAGGAACASGAGYANAPLEDVPLLSDGSPIAGSVQLSENSSWEVANGKQEQAYQVTTPTAIYFLHLASGALVSLTDPGGTMQWIQYSYGGQPDRGIPMLGGCCSPPQNGEPPLVPMVTAKDSAQSSSTHLRVSSSSADGKWRLSWDFYLTHATVTVEQAGADYGFSYKGTPGGPAAALQTDLWLTGTPKLDAATYAGNKDLPYPEWARFAEPSNGGQSLFVLQHRDDCLSDSYQARTLPTEKTAVFTFGSGKIPAAHRTRFSFGLVANSDAEARIDYVLNLMK